MNSREMLKLDQIALPTSDNKYLLIYIHLSIKQNVE